MTNDDRIDYALTIIGIVLIIAGIWMFKDFGAARFEATKGLCLEYKYDIIVGTILVLSGAAFAMMVGNNNFKRYFRRKR